MSTQTINVRVEWTNSQKWLRAVILGILFAILAAPFMYNITNSLFSRLGLYTTNGGGATPFGLILHAIVFTLLARLVLN